MYDEFTKIEKNYGNVFINGRDIGRSYYEFTYNPYKTNEMKILLVNPPFSIINYLNNDFTEVSVKISFPNGVQTIQLNYKLFSYTLSNKGNTISCPVEEVNIEHDMPCKKDESFVYLGFFFPLTAVTNNCFDQIKHSDYGLMRGNYDVETDKIDLRKENFVIKTILGEFKISDTYEFFDLPSNELYELVTVLKQSIMCIKVPFDINNFETDIRNVLKYVENLFTLLSFLERDRINWTSSHIRILNHEENYDKYIETFRWCPPVNENYYKAKNDFSKRKDTFTKIVHSFDLMEVGERNSLLDLIKNMEIANCASTIETQMIHWHSCLDFFRKKYHKKSNSFSKDLIDLLDKNKICINDLIPEEILGDIRNKVKNKSTFSFTQLRNAYIHDGFDSFEGQYEKVMEGNNIMRCICERYILNCFGISFSDTVLGYPK